MSTKKDTYLSKQIFMQKYVLGRTSHKNDIDKMLKEAEEVWNKIDKGNWY